MLFVYNLLQLILLPLLSPLLVLLVLCKAKYRYRTASRLGLGLSRTLAAQGTSSGRRGPVFWIHALSIGETTSAIPLMEGIRRTKPQAILLLSVTTRSGRKVAEQIRPGLVDYIINSPLDILPVVHFFIKKIKPDCFLLVETDFWPNLLHLLKKKGVPTILVNGRVSDEALQGYRKMRFFAQPMFQNLDALCLQTKGDQAKLASLGIAQKKLHTLGNLKFDTQLPDTSSLRKALADQLPANRLLLIAGSTHTGEDELLIETFLTLRHEFPALYLIIAPRDLSRVSAIMKYCGREKLACRLRTEKTAATEKKNEIFLLNTIGELAACYQLADLAFVGGSLVPQGGHNPIEPALFAHPVLFGPHMEDFSEIAEEMRERGGAFQVEDQAELIATLRTLLQSETKRKSAGAAAQRCVLQQRGVIDRHLHLIDTFLVPE